MSTLVEHRPGAPLTGAVVRAVGFEDPDPGRWTSREYPGATVPLVIDLGSGWEVGDPRDPVGRTQRLRSFVAGVWDGPTDVANAGPARCAQYDLDVRAARRILGVPMSELANRAVALDDVLGGSARDLSERMSETEGWRARFALVDAVLARRLHQAPPADAGVSWALDRIAATGGSVRIGHLARDLGWSHRRLIARFRDQVGVAPKTVARVARLQGVLACAAGAHGDWARVAATCGYADQAHLVREVRALTGTTPGRLTTVNSVQDGGAGPS